VSDDRAAVSAVPVLADRSDRDAIREDLDSTLVVEAAAGTGKTTALVSRILSVISSGRGELSRIVAVTFTEKAAGELKLRLRGELEKGRTEARGKGSDEVRQRLERGLAQLEEAHVGTIHGFCADLLKQRPLQAGVDPLFEVATEEEKDRLYRRVFDRWLQEKLSDPPPGVRRLMRRPQVWEEGPVDTLYKAGYELLEVRDFPARWQIRPFERESEIDALVERAFSLGKQAETAGSDRDYLFLDLSELLAFMQDLTGQEQVSGRRDYDALEHRLGSLKLGKRKGRGPYSDGVSREKLLAERDALASDLASFQKRARADVSAHLQNELRELVDRYEGLKSKRGRLDFLDLLVRARDLLKGDPEVRRELQSSFTHIFVDEFQDTDPLQAEILLLLASANPDEDDWRKIEPVPGKLFLVADPKQSIYRFRRADVALYQRVRNQLVRAGARRIHLTVSFRSVPGIQELVNSAMTEAMRPTPENHQADYVQLHAHRAKREGQPAVVALPVPRPYGDWERVVFYAIQRSEPQAVASWIRWLLEESASLGWRVSSRGEASRPIAPSDVCLLFRRFVSFGRAVTQPYVDALSAFDIPHVLVGGRGFHQREEIEAMRVALAAIERPDDELSVFSTLRGPLFSLGDESLFLFRARHGPLHPFRATPGALEEDAVSVRGALDVLASLHRDRNRRPIALTVRELLDQTRAHAGFALWQAGDQVLANVLRLVQLARTFEESGGLSFRGFVDHLDSLSEVSDRTEQPTIEDGVEGVRLMTVHKAKGLEFPVVILCEITSPFSSGASRHVDPDRKLFAMRLAGGSPWELLEHEDSEAERDRAESLRLLYVAATRARDILVVPVVADEPQVNGWVGPLLPSLYPEERTSRLPVVAPGCPRFPGDDTVLERPPRATVASAIRPGLHKPERGRHEVVWWDPSLFENPLMTKPGLRRHTLLHASPGDEPGTGAVEYQRWLERRDRILEQGSAPRYRVETVTRLVETERPVVEGAAQVLIAEVEGRDLLRPGGKRFGALVHEVLARAALDAAPSDTEGLAESLGRILGNSEEERAAAASAVTRALAHPLLQKARAASVVFRETPLVYREPGGRLVEGVPDLVFRDGDSDWTLVDFKTDLRLDIAEALHRGQVALYGLALQEATGRPAVGWLLYI
jgi:ATP-dependent exoDNAse (exonuclease V) beta subunit